ncbi:hypothetical protein BDW42DRAFT_69494 [Aspergillus taichungensis]|uniref:Transmembrane protein n=1 Tax=Aspergillus taichungensis TaxID=482145 RepID=A0A2J5HCE6_9EURO|nr:hypothetical protein BDW42DRAFT_69494 [Aspergillus taichungensis]
MAHYQNSRSLDSPVVSHHSVPASVLNRGAFHTLSSALFFTLSHNTFILEFLPLFFYHPPSHPRRLAPLRHTPSTRRNTRVLSSFYPLPLPLFLFFSFLFFFSFSSFLFLFLFFLPFIPLT